MIHFVFNKNDKRYLFLKFDTPEDDEWLRKKDRNEKKERKNLTDYLNLIDKTCYLSTYKGEPYTNDFIWEYYQKSGNKIYYCSSGLWQIIYKFFKDNNVPFDGLIENKDFFKQNLKHSFEEFKDIVKSWNLSLEPRPYQYESAYKILQWNKSISKLATRAGKTLIAYMVFRYSWEYFNARKILMIVPSVDLVKQGFKDFSEYSEFFKTECIWSGGKQVESSNLTIGTFQSLIKYIEKKTPQGLPNPKYNPHFFDDYDIVFVDETHRAKANQIKNIISQPFMLNTKIAFGMTGTLPKEHTTDFYCVHSLLGAKIQEINPRKLMDEGYISDIEITQYRLKYTNKEKQEKTFIRCAEYVLSEYETEINPKNGKKEKNYFR